MTPALRAQLAKKIQHATRRLQTLRMERRLHHSIIRRLPTSRIRKCSQQKRSLQLGQPPYAKKLRRSITPRFYVFDWFLSKRKKSKIRTSLRLLLGSQFLLRILRLYRIHDLGGCLLC